jgi:hypothetical protein
MGRYNTPANTPYNAPRTLYAGGGGGAAPGYVAGPGGYGTGPGGPRYAAPVAPGRLPLHPEDREKDMNAMRCRSCGAFGHLMRYCPTVVCFCCYASGHMASVCPFA